jgi:hypothetical protein
MLNDYWDLMAEMARLQSQLGEDLAAWAKMYEAGGNALQRSGRTLGEVAELGRRMEHSLESGPPAVVTRMLQMLASPFPGLGVGMGMPPGAASAAGPFAQFWEAWASSLGPRDPARSGPDQGA